MRVSPALFARAVLFLLILGVGGEAHGQYYPRGVRYNDNYLPNLEAPDKLSIAADGMVDYRKEKDAQANTTYQVNHFHGSFYYGGRQIRGGLLVMIDNSSLDVKTTTIGGALSFYRPWFFEVGLGLAQRSSQTVDDDGWAVNFKAGYEHPIVLQVNYRLRLRFSVNFGFQDINANVSNLDVLQIYPLLGIEFET